SFDIGPVLGGGDRLWWSGGGVASAPAADADGAAVDGVPLDRVVARIDDDDTGGEGAADRVVLDLGQRADGSGDGGLAQRRFLGVLERVLGDDRRVAGVQPDARPAEELVADDVEPFVRLGAGVVDLLGLQLDFLEDGALPVDADEAFGLDQAENVLLLITDLGRG